MFNLFTNNLIFIIGTILILIFYLIKKTEHSKIIFFLSGVTTFLTYLTILFIYFKIMQNYPKNFKFFISSLIAFNIIGYLFFSLSKFNIYILEMLSSLIFIGLIPITNTDYKYLHYIFYYVSFVLGGIPNSIYIQKNEKKNIENNNNYYHYLGILLSSIIIFSFSNLLHATNAIDLTILWSLLIILLTILLIV